MIDAVILKALQDGATAAVAASSDPTLPINYIDVDFDPSISAPNGKYLELVFIPNNAENETWGSEQTYMGMFRLILHWSNNDVSGGPYVPMNLIGSICSYFYKGRKLDGVQVTNAPVFTGRLAQGHEILYPASLRYLRFEHA